MDQGMLTGAVFIEFQKVFDTVNHNLDMWLNKVTYLLTYL